jgi:2'-5' RNA ligase
VNNRDARKRIFFALWPSEKQRQKIEAAIAPYKTDLKGKWTARENWHVTLVFIGGFPERDIAALLAVAGKIRRRDVTLRFERIEYWKRPKIICLGGDFIPNELFELVSSLEKVAQRFGYVPEKRTFRSHMTVARKAGFFDPVTLARPLELKWSGFELVESQPIPGGVRYRPLKQ